MESKIERPGGLIFLAFFFVLGAYFNIQIGLSWIYSTPDTFRVMFSGAPLFDILGNVWWFEGELALLMGVVNLILAVGIWFGKGWAWHLWLITSVLTIILNLVNLPIGFSKVQFTGDVLPASSAPFLYAGYIYAFSIILGIFSIYYRTRPDVKTFFGRS